MPPCTSPARLPRSPLGDGRAELDEAGVHSRPVRHRRPDARSTRVPIEVSLLPTLFESLHVGMLTMDAQGSITGVSPQAELLLGYTERELSGMPLHGTLHARREDGTPYPAEECALLGVLRTARAAERDREVFLRRDGTALLVSWVAAPILLAGELTGAVIAFHDVGVHDADPGLKDEELALIRAANERLQLLAEATTVLTSTLDVHEALQQLADLVVPRLADWSVVDLFQPPGRVERIAIAHHERGRVPAPVYRLLPQLTDESQAPLAQALRDHRTVVVRSFPDPESLGDPLHREQSALFAELGAADAIVAPLAARGRTVGALTVVRLPDSVPYGPGDIALVDDLAGRAALAVDNARMYTEQRRFAEQLQLTLLPRLPRQVGDLSLATRYLAASDFARVGGDWYDAFVTRDGAVALAIGDVVGHDLDAALTMGSVRHKLRAITGDRLGPTADVLTRLDAVLQQFSTTELTTAVLLRVTRGDGDEHRVEWSNAGHLPPIVLGPDGALRRLAGPADLPLGVGGGERSSSITSLRPGSVVVLYTDGLVERRGEDIEAGLRQLEEAVAASAGAPLDDLLDSVIDAMHPSRGDDVALLAVRTPR